MLQRLTSIELWCAAVIERGFALVFRSALEPVQVAQKLVVAYEGLRGGARPAFVVAISPADYERLAPELPTLCRQWMTMLATLAAHAGAPEPAPRVRVESRTALPIGTVTIVAEPYGASTDQSNAVIDAPNATTDRPLYARIVKGVPARGVYPLVAGTVVGRDANCDIVLGDPRVSRRHLAIESGAGGVLAYRDLESANGIMHNGERRATGVLRPGDILQLGDSLLAIESSATEPITAKHA